MSFAAISQNRKPKILVIPNHISREESAVMFQSFKGFNTKS